MYTYWRHHNIDLYDVPPGFQERLQRYELCNIEKEFAILSAGSHLGGYEVLLAADGEEKAKLPRSSDTWV